MDGCLTQTNRWALTATIEIIMAQDLQMPLARLLSVVAHVKPHERKAAVLAFACNFVLLGSYYILRSLRDTMATIFGVAELSNPNVVNKMG